MKRALLVLTLVAALGTIGLRAQSAAAASAPSVAPGGPYAGVVGVPIQFSAAATTDSGTDLSYVWTFGDGETATGMSVFKTYYAAGGYSVSLTVTDRFGLTTTAYTSASINSVLVLPPAAFGSSVPSQLVDPATVGLCVNGITFDCNTHLPRRLSSRLPVTVVALLHDGAPRDTFIENVPAVPNSAAFP